MAGQAPSGKLHRQVIGPKAQVGELEGVPKLLGQGSFHPLHLGQEGVNHLVPSGGEQLLCGDVRPGRRVEGVILACGDVAAVEQAWMWNEAQFEAFLRCV